MKTFALTSLIEAQTIFQSMKTFALFVYHYTFFYLFCKYFLSIFQKNDEMILFIH
ncbi:hypothetical protein bcere0022_31610 [Bacillus cereus Rock3-44]|nr:hypothetical protein bcere0022_31610 [Bacillus cereus Rock3-44]